MSKFPFYSLPKSFAEHSLKYPEKITNISPPKSSDWECYLFGNKPGGMGLVYRPIDGQVPNWVVRLMMKVCFACTWKKII